MERDLVLHREGAAQFLGGGHDMSAKKLRIWTKLSVSEDSLTIHIQKDLHEHK